MCSKRVFTNFYGFFEILSIMLVRIMIDDKRNEKFTKLTEIKDK